MSAVAGLAAFGFAGCGAAEEPTAGVECQDGEHRVCYQEQSRSESAITCRTGSQACEQGTWGPCQGGLLEQVPLGEVSLLRPLARSIDEDCDNDCNPWCRVWDEEGPVAPDEGTEDVIVGTDWRWCDASISDCDIASVPPTSDETGVCEHGLCSDTDTSPLDPRCHWCVAAVCDVMPSCCATSWSDSCKELVFTECAELDVPPPTGLCDYGVVARGNITYSNDNFEYEPKGPVAVNGALTAGNRHIFREIYATGNISLGDHVTVLGDIVTSGGTIHAEQFLDVGGNLFAAGNIYLNGGAEIDGSIVTSGSVTFANTAALIGGTIEAGGGISWSTAAPIYDSSVVAPTAPTVEIPELPTRDVDATGTGVCNAGTTDTTCAEGTHAQLYATNMHRVDFTCADSNCLYQFGPNADGSNPPDSVAGPAIFFDNGNSTLDLKCGWDSTTHECTTHYDIRAEGDIHFGNNLAITCSDCPDRTAWGSADCTEDSLCELDITRIQWYTNGNVVTGTPILDFYGIILAPNGYLDAERFDGRGMVWVGGNVFSQPDNIMDADGLQAMCESDVPEGGGGIDPTNCPIEDNQSGALAPIREPCQSGEDCQANHRCTAVATNIDDPSMASQPAPKCDHSKCQPGTPPLVAACDPCVEMICADSPSCCTTEWTSACVDLVKTICDADCGTAPSSSETASCTHNPCDTTDTDPLDAMCDDGFTNCVQAICNSGDAFARPECCTTSWSAACVQEAAIRCEGLPRPGAGLNGNLCNYAVVAASGFVDPATPVNVDGGIYANSSVTIRDDSSDTFYGSIVSQGDISHGDTMIYESAYATGTISGAGAILGEEVAGTTLTGTGFNPIPGSPGVATYSTCGSTVPVGNHGALQLSSWCQMALQAGEYHVSSLTLGEGATLVAPVTGVARVYVHGDVVLDEQARIASSLPADEAYRVQIVAAGDITMMDDSIEATGFFAAPNGTFRACRAGMFGASPSITGLVHANSVDICSTTRIDGSASVGAPCETSGYDQGTHTDVPIVPPITCSSDDAIDMEREVWSNGAGTCVPNEPGYVDPEAPSADLSADIPCETIVPVCNHGGADISGSLAIGFWPSDTGDIYTSHPDPVWRLGHCETSVTIPSGYCTDIDLTDSNVTCTGIDAASLAANDYALLVNWDSDPTAADARLAEFSYLDNWTLYRSGRDCTDICHPESATCATIHPALTTQFTERYHADCPGTTKSKWSMLWWDTEIPDSAAEVIFEWRSANSEAELDAKSFNSIGPTATSSDPDCDQYDDYEATGCPVKFPDEMTTEETAHEYLDLRITIEPNFDTDYAGAGVRLNGWEVRFDCRDSE